MFLTVELLYFRNQIVSIQNVMNNTVATMSLVLELKLNDLQWKQQNYDMQVVYIGYSSLHGDGVFHYFHLVSADEKRLCWMHNLRYLYSICTREYFSRSSS